MNTPKWLGIAAAVTLLACGKPQYPACEGDDDCKEKGEVCVDKKCVECNSDAACVKKLGAGASCRENLCRAAVKAECQVDGDCGDGKKCEAQKCKDARVACSNDKECGGTGECFAGFCREKQKLDNVSSQCRDMSNPTRVALQSVNFDLDASDIRPDAQATLEQNAACLKQAPEQKVTLEGHCDERGTMEYNLTLGEQRAGAVEKVLERLGVEKKRMRILSKGKAEPVCRASTDECYAKNRRVDFK